MDLKILKEYGIDCDKGIARCMNDSGLYETILTMFLDDTCLERAKKHIANKDNTELFKCMHELKGASGNVDITALYEAVCPLVELLRGGGGTEAEITPMFAKIEAAYNRAKEGIALARG